MGVFFGPHARRRPRRTGAGRPGGCGIRSRRRTGGAAEGRSRNRCDFRGWRRCTESLLGRIPASVLGRFLRYHAGGEMGPDFGAARLARLAVTGENPSVVCAPPPVLQMVEPVPDLVDACGSRPGCLPAPVRDIESRVRTPTSGLPGNFEQGHPTTMRLECVRRRCAPLPGWKTGSVWPAPPALCRDGPECDRSPTTATRD